MKKINSFLTYTFIFVIIYAFHFTSCIASPKKIVEPPPSHKMTFSEAIAKDREYGNSSVFRILSSIRKKSLNKNVVPINPNGDKK